MLRDTFSCSHEEGLATKPLTHRRASATGPAFRNFALEMRVDCKSLKIGIQPVDELKILHKYTTFDPKP
jgi:hypothetical protein